MSFEERVGRRVPILETFCEQICTISEEVLLRLRASDQDPFGVMSVCFLSKQFEHLRTIRIISRRRDSELIARSMIEGLGQLHWAAKDKATRPALWREFGHVLQFRMLREHDELAAAVNSETRERILSRADQLVHFYSKDARRATERGQPLPSDPFQQDWTGCSPRTLIGQLDVNGPGLYSAYRRFSEWHHWNFAGIARALEGEGPAVSFQPESAVSSSQALAIGFQCLFQTVEVVAAHFGIETESQLSPLYENYHRSHADFFSHDSEE